MNFDIEDLLKEFKPMICVNNEMNGRKGPFTIGNWYFVKEIDPRENFPFDSYIVTNDNGVLVKAPKRYFALNVNIERLKKLNRILND